MKRLVSVAVAVLALTEFALGKDENGLRVEVTKTTISNDDKDDRGYYDKVDRTLGLKVQAKNISMKPMDVGQLEWIILVERWGSDQLERYKGKETFPPLKPGEMINLTVGQSSIGGYKSLGKRYQDKLEAWSVVVRHHGVDTITLVSSSAFERANAKAKDAAKE